MTAHLLLVALGPVQEFIAQARRTRDLWHGSHLLSELSRAAARALVDGGAKLIFPTLQQGDPQLVACNAQRRSDGTRPMNIANKLLAEVPEGVDPSDLARKAREAVMKFWRDDVAAPVRTRCSGLLASDIDAVWNEQIETLPEFAAGWLPLGEYTKTRAALERAVASRKMLRDFEPWRQSRPNTRKSSLDGARESVLAMPQQRDRYCVRRYRIVDGDNLDAVEHLDAVGLVKRAGGTPEQFVPLTTVALASWTAEAASVAPAELSALIDECKKLRLARVERADLPCATTFPFEGGVLWPNRWAPVLREFGATAEPQEWGRKFVRPLYDKLGEPYPYVACLVADGDQMGAALSSLNSAEAHRSFSAALAAFADRAREVVEQRHRGALVYAGGDDVLAFLPLPEALACADALRTAFVSVMQGAAGDAQPDKRPTLSVGLGVGHVLESMGDLLALGRRAEREAKRDRNALAIIVDKRSGGSRTWRAKWSTNPVPSLATAIELQTDRALPSRKIHEIDKGLNRLPMPTEVNDERWARILALEVSRTLSRADDRPLRAADVGLELDASVGYARLHEQVSAWIARMLIARTFARAAIRERSAQESST